MTILEEIVESVRRRVKEQKEERSVEEIKIDSGGGRSLIGEIKSTSEVSVIGEVKRASPSSGTIRENFRPSRLAESIAEGGAAGISVLTEPNYFHGEIDHLTEVSNSVEAPVLRKDFILDEHQLYQSAEAGADSVLLISEILGDDLSKFLELARDLNMEPLVEVTKASHLDLAKSAGAKLIGINNRDLKSMKIDLSRTERILNNASNDFISVSESGIDSRDDVKRMGRAGADAVLVGTAIMNSDDVLRKVRSLRGVHDG